MPITSALSVRREPDWASMQQTIEIRLVNRRWYTAHLVELICLLPVTTCPKRSGSGGTSWKLSCARARARARVSERSRVISIRE